METNVASANGVDSLPQIGLVTPSASYAVELTAAIPPSASTHRQEIARRVSREVLKAVITQLNLQPDIVKGPLYHGFRGALNTRLQQLAVMSRSRFMEVAQRLGLLQHWGPQSRMVWRVIDVSHFDELVTDQLLSKAYDIVIEQEHTRARLRQAKQYKKDLVRTKADLQLAEARIRQLERLVSTARPTSRTDSPAAAEELLMPRVAGMKRQIDALRDQLLVAEQTAAALRDQPPRKPTLQEMADYLDSFLIKPPDPA